MNRQRVAIITMDLMGGDAMYKIVSEKDYLTVISDEFIPTKKYKGRYDKEERDVLDSGKYQDKVLDFFHDYDKDDNNDKVLKSWFTQTFCPEEIDLTEYNVIGMLTLPGG